MEEGQKCDRCGVERRRTLEEVRYVLDGEPFARSSYFWRCSVGCLFDGTIGLKELRAAELEIAARAMAEENQAKREGKMPEAFRFARAALGLRVPDLVKLLYPEFEDDHGRSTWFREIEAGDRMVGNETRERFADLIMRTIVNGEVSPSW